VTFMAVLAAMRCRWYLVVVALLVVAVVFVMFAREGGGYTTKTAVTFLVPSTTSLSPDNGSGDTSVIAFARSVAAQVNNGRDPVSYSMDDAPYYGAGLRQGVLVVVPNDGNQWYSSFTHAEIDIQIVGRTEKWVKQEQAEYVKKILSSTQAQQAGIVSNPANYLTASVLPLTLVIDKVAPTRSALLAAAAAMLVAWLIVSAGGAVLLDRRLSRRRSVRAVAVGRPTRFSLKDSMI
jgi:hypothetical protein